MKRILFIGIVAAAAALLGFSGCTSVDPQDPEVLVSDLALTLSDYSVYKATDLSSSSDEETTGSDSQAEVIASMASVEFDESAKALGVGDADVTVVDNLDGTVTVTRTWSVDDEALYKLVIVRPMRPAAEDFAQPDAVIVQEATETRYVNDIQVSSADLTITWKLDGTDVYRYTLVRVGETLKPGGTVLVRTEAEWDSTGDLVERTVTYIRTAQDGTLVTRSFTVTLVTMDGVEYRKLVEEGKPGYMVVKSRNPRIVEHYTDAGVLFLIVTHERVPGQGITVTRTWYENGIVTGTTTGTIRVKTENGLVVIVRFDGSRRIETTIEDTETGYAVTRNGVTYTVSIVDGKTIITTSEGSWAVTWAPDGEPVLEEII